MKHFYAIRHNDFSWNDSDEKIRDWGTAEIIEYNNKKERDAAVTTDPYICSISAKRAHYIKGGLK